MNIVMIIPTGIGCEIGGHAGDATPAARLLGSVCDKLIIHPNVVNASDINEQPENALYVEGSILDRFLEGKVELKEVKQNRILVAVNKPCMPGTVNTVSGARATLGINAEIIELDTPLLMRSFIKDGIADGEYTGVSELISQMQKYDFDALAIASEITFAKEMAFDYFRKEGTVNPWGGIESKVSRAIALGLNKPIAHAPFEVYKQGEISSFDEITDPRKAAEAAAGDFLFCVLKGLHKAPRIGKGLSVDDIDVMVSPYGCWGRPHYACAEAGVPIILVKENTCVLNEGAKDDNVLFVENYLEAAGVIAALDAGITIESVRRPLKPTEIINA